MPLRRLHRRIVAVLLAFCVLVAQSLAVVYACERPASLDEAPAVPCMSHMDDGGRTAPGVPLANGNVCAVHCEAVSLPDAGAPSVPMPVAVVAWRLPDAPLAPASAGPVADVDARSSSPPPRTLFARLLI
jgi:hypothetical protein